MNCQRCGHEIVRKVEQPGPGELRRVSWDCKCHSGGAVGAAVEWAQRGGVGGVAPQERERRYERVGASGARAAFRQ